MTKHEMVKTKHETRRRVLTVTAVSHLTPRMRRIEFTSEELHDFVSPSPDDHIKIFLPSSSENPIMRDFTPRDFNLAAGTLTLDFALHQAGPATTWAANVIQGDTLEIGGPRGSSIVPDDFDWYLLIGDATAMPSFGRRLQHLRADVPVATIIAVESPEEQQEFTTNADWTAHWVFQNPTENGTSSLIEAFRQHPLPAGEGFIWIATEAAESRSLYELAVEIKGHPAIWTKAASYWTRGAAGK